MHRHEKVRGLLKSVISEVNDLERVDYDDERKRSMACDKISDKLHTAYILINELKKEFEEKI
ncbi:hypothetical protein HQ533_00590 [Candidatus Woesearchaeota archaeon]|nr:hypothetical protein [Candidatus Woesearchaeota archaeon]